MVTHKLLTTQQYNTTTNLNKYNTYLASTIVLINKYNN